MADFVPVAEVDTKEFVPVEEVQDKPFVPVEEVAPSQPKAPRFTQPMDIGEQMKGAYARAAAVNGEEIFKPFPAAKRIIENVIPSPPAETEEMRMTGVKHQPTTSEKVALKIKGAAESLASPGGVGLGVAAALAPEIVGPLMAVTVAPQLAEGVKQVAQGEVLPGLTDIALAAPVVLGGAEALRRSVPGKPSLLPETAKELQKLGGKDAIQERGATPVPMEKPPATGAEVGARVSEPETPALPQVVREQQPQPAAQEVSPVRDVTPLQLALQAQRDAGWNTKWPFVPADLMNRDFREMIRNDPSLPAETKAQIFSAGEKLGVVPKGETAEPFTPVEEVAKPAALPPEPSAGTEVKEGATIEAPQPPVEGRGATPKSRGIERPPDIIDYIAERIGSIRGKKHAKPGSEGYYSSGYDDARSGAGRQLFKESGQSPDEVLDTLRREGAMPPNATVDDLWDAIKNANGYRRAHFRGETPEVQADKFSKAIEAQGKKKGSHVVSVGDLSIGDKFTIGTEELEVVSIDADTGEVTVKDGRKYGYQTIPDGADVPVAKGSLKTAPKVPVFAEEDFALNAPESVEQQKARLAAEEATAKHKAERAKLEEAAAKPLVGSRGDIGQKDMFGGGDLLSREPSVGPGAASPSDVSEPGTVVSNMFAAIDRDRVANGKEPMPPGESRTWEQDQKTAMARINRDPQWIPNLIKEVAEKPRPLLSWEQAGTVIQKAFWKAEYNNALRRIANAVDSKLAEEELVRAKTDAARFEDAIAEMEDAVGRGGTGSEAGRTLQAQKMGLNDELTLVEMRLEARHKLGGRRLTEEETAKVDQIHAEYKQKVAALEKATADAEMRRIEAETRATLAELGRQTAEAKVPAPHIQKLIDRVGQTIHDRANAARERLKGKLFTLSPDVLKDLAEIGADNIWTIGEDFGRWSAKMVADIGERVRPHLQAVWEASKKLVTDTWDAQAGPKSKKPAPPKVVELAKQTIKKGDSATQRREKLTARIVDRVEKRQMDRITPAVQKLARTFIEEGIHDREALIDAVHEVLADAIPDWTRRQTMDAISGYGEYKTLSKDQISVKLRDLKGQMQQIAKLEDMAAGEAPLRTGLERREVTKAQSELIKLVNEAKRRGGYETTDPTRQLRTALDEVKKRTQTAIDDYETRIANQDYAVRKTEPIRPDAELLNKQAELKRTRKKWEQQKREWELGKRKFWQRALDRAVRWERFFKLSSPVVFGKLAGAAVTRFAETVTSETAGAGLGLVPGIRQVARQAPREGGFNAKALAKGFVSAWRKGMSDAAQTLTKGAADIDVMFGEKLIDKDWANYMGQLHGMMKAPVKRFEFELALEKRTENAIKNGLDPSDPLVSARLHAEALNDGYRSIFMQRGFSSDMFNQMVSQMEKSKKYPVQGEVSARLLRFLLPVVRVPANIVAETATGIGGAPIASARTMFHAINGTLNKLDPVVADSIMRQFKKGSIGLGLMAIGYFNPQSVGGFDWKEKRKPGEVKTAGFQIGGTDIPRWLTHAPWFELMQFGSTIRRVKDQHVAKTGSEKGISEGMWAAGLGLVEETPFVGQMLRVDKIFQSPAERTYYLGELAKSTLLPQAVIKAAELMDDGTQRKPTTIWEHVKMGIPGKRPEVPAKPAPKPKTTLPRYQRPAKGAVLNP